MIKINLRDIYRATDVTRWQIVKTGRQQNVAEHSYMVAMIAIKICEVLQCDGKTVDEVIRHALVHDIAEVFTGDIATPTKRLMGDQAEDILRRFENSLEWVSFLPLGTATVSKSVKFIVKQADLIEAIAFLHGNSGSDHGDMIMNRLITKVHPECLPVMLEITGGDITTMDDIIEAIDTKALHGDQNGAAS